VALECVEGGIPKRAYFFQFFDQFLDREAAPRRELVDSLPPYFLRPDETGPPEHPRVLANRGTADRKAARQLSRPARLAGQASQQFPASGIGERPDGRVYRHRENM